MPFTNLFVMTTLRTTTCLLAGSPSRLAVPARAAAAVEVDRHRAGGQEDLLVAQKGQGTPPLRMVSPLPQSRAVPIAGWVAVGSTSAVNFPCTFTRYCEPSRVRVPVPW